MEQTDQSQKTCFLAGLYITDPKKRSNQFDIFESMKELEELAKADGLSVVGNIIQNRENYDVATYMGKGKIEEIARLCQETGAQILIFNEELSGAQLRNIEEMTGLLVSDRTSLILDIFAKRAISHEGRLQVELAQLRYLLPRLKGEGIELSGQAGGIGSKGPGEKKLETDKRHIRSRIDDIRKELKEIVRNRGVQRAQRSKSELPVVALVGYTNAGKSSLLNELIKSHGEYEQSKEVSVKDQLFVTLDTTLRKAVLPSHVEYLVTDTVGFVSSLPHELVEAFKATLEEVVQADLLLQVVDASNENMDLQMQTTNDILKQIGADQKPMVYVFNKADKTQYQLQIPSPPNSVFISVKQHYNLSALYQKIEDILLAGFKKVRLEVPYSDTKIISRLHEKYHFEEEFNETAVEFDIALGVEDLGRYAPYILSMPQDALGKTKREEL